MVMSSVVERQRLLHREIDVLVDQAVEALSKAQDVRRGETSKQRCRRLMREAVSAALIEQTLSKQDALLSQYLSSSGTRQEEIDTIKCLTAESPIEAAVNEFRLALKGLKTGSASTSTVTQESDVHSIFPPQFTDIAQRKALLPFREQEHIGRFLDLGIHYERFMSIAPDTPGTPSTLMKYVASIDDFSYIAKNTKQRPEYRQFLSSLRDDLLRYHRGRFPLHDIDTDLDRVKSDVMSDLQLGKLTNWSEYSTITDGEDNGNPTNYCVACKRVFANSAVFEGHLSGKAHRFKQAKLDKRLKKHGSPNDNVGGINTANDLLKKRIEGLVVLEWEIKALADRLREDLDDTVKELERTATLTDKERAMERQELLQAIMDVDVLETSDDEILDPVEQGGQYGTHDLEQMYTDVDGTPIPRWLWKLRGLNQEFVCEICANDVFKGPHAFHNHFKRSKHSAGLHMLGIKFSPEFIGVTGIEEAKALWESIHTRAMETFFRPGHEEDAE
eukprot:Clim_evm84s172 gene=Clim_evmTU84s172